MPMAKNLVELRDVYKIYGEGRESEVRALDGVSLTIGKGEFVAVVGQSGSGKSTMMNVLGCLDIPTRGTYLLGGTDVRELTDKELSHIRNKQIGFIFQQYNLIQSLTVLENVELPLIYQGVNADDRRDMALEALARVGLANRIKHRPVEMSGGQQQRVALARAFVIEPGVLLMDEPLSNLDAKLRVEMRSVIRHTQKSVGITTVYVTHDQEEAMAISDRIAVMKDGVIQHVGTPRDIYQRPKNVFVATFIGRTNIVNAHVKDGIITFADGYHEHIDALDKAAEQDVRCSIRPEEFIICKDGTDGIHGTVQECTYLGLNTHYTIDTDQGDSVEIVEESSIGEGLKKGEKVLLKVKKEKINVFTKDGGTNLIRSDAYEKQ